MIWMPMYIHVIFSYLAAVGFAVFLNSPKKTLYVAGSIGMISWVIYVLLMRINIDMMTSNFIAASIAALLSEILARKMKKPTILFIVPGIIVGLMFSQSYYILSEDPSKSITQCIKESVDMMNGHKWDLFYLELTFIGWWLLTAITVGIAGLWVAPYVKVTETNFYLSIKNN